MCAGHNLGTMKTAWIATIVMMAPPLHAQERNPTATMVGSVHAKGILVARIEFPAADAMAEITPRLAGSDGAIRDAKVQVPRGDPFRAGRSSEVPSSGTAVVITPLIGRFDIDSPSFLFAEAGKYDMLWDIAYKGNARESTSVKQRVQVAPATRWDLTFLNRLSDMEFILRIHGKDPFTDGETSYQEWARGPEGADYRALRLITELLEATYAKEPGDIAGPHGRSIEDAVRWADELQKLATELPESSYAPYSSYFAGCGYLLGMAQENKVRHGSIAAAAGVQSAFYRKAADALEFAIANGDIYLRPRALYMHGILHAWTNSWDDARQVLENATVASREQPTVQEMVNGLRAELVLARQRTENDVTKTPNDK